MQKVAVHFDCPEVSYLFSHIVEMHGAESVITDNFSDFEKVITETKYFESLPLILRGSSCLLVKVEEDQRFFPALSLSRPLKQDNISNAMKRLLN